MIIRRTRRLSSLRSRRGAALVEMAFIFPIFVAIVLGIIEFGRGMMVAQILTNSAREAARMAVMDGSTNSGVAEFLRQSLQTTVGANASDVSVSVTITPAAGNPNPQNDLANAHSKDLVEVRVSIPFDKVTFAGGEYLAGKSLVGVSTMRHE